MTPPTCPTCGTEMVRYVVGLPINFDEMQRAHRAKEIVWSGSCLGSPDDPKWVCPNCYWRQLEELLAGLNVPGPRSQGDPAGGSETP